MANLTKSDDLRKELVKKAKMRMLRNDYDALAANAEIEAESSYERSGERLEHYIKVVREIKESDTFVYDPMKRMMDETYYNALPENEKLGYILGLSKIYKELSSQYKKD